MQPMAPPVTGARVHPQQTAPLLHQVPQIIQRPPQVIRAGSRDFARQGWEVLQRALAMLFISEKTL